jgi:predicted transcriptional regulator
MGKYYGPKYENKMKPQMREILQLKKVGGKQNYDTLYVLFDRNRSGNAGPTIQMAKKNGFVKQTADGDVELTQAGEKILSDQEYWR